VSQATGRRRTDELKSVHVGHPIIHDEASRPRQRRVAEKVSCALVETYVEAFALECELQRMADGLMIVDDQYRPCLLFHDGA
jgi:hypothetical protein